MKTARTEIRVEPNLKRYLESAAAYDRRSLSELLLKAAIDYAETLKARGWKAKDAPQVRDGRRRAAA